MKQNYKSPQPQNPEHMCEAQRKRITFTMDFNSCYRKKQNLIVSYAPNNEKSIFNALSGHNSKQLQQHPYVMTKNKVSQFPLRYIRYKLQLCILRKNMILWKSSGTQTNTVFTHTSNSRPAIHKGSWWSHNDDFLEIKRHLVLLASHK